MNKFFYRKILAVTVAGVAVVAVYFYTDSTIKTELAPTTVVVAKQDIPPHTEITKEMLVEASDIPRKALPQESPYASSIDEVAGKWTVDGYGISAKGFINTKKVVDIEKLPDAGLLELKEGEYAFPILVDLETSHGNAIRPDSYVDLYFSTKIQFTSIPLEIWQENGLKLGTISIEDEPLFFGKIASKVRVVDVKDNRSNNVFTTDEYTEAADGATAKSSTKKTTARLYTIAVDLETLEYLNKAKLKGEVIPIAHGESYAKSDKEEVQKENQEEDQDVVQEEEDQEVLPEADGDISITQKVIEVLTFNPTM